MSGIILFDGECNFCDKSVQFILKRDVTGYYKFASLQSGIGQRLVNDYRIPRHLDSLIVIDKATVYTKSSAALQICRNLKGIWKVNVIFLVIPKPIRDIVYDIIAKNRYKWFGKKDYCMIPSREMKDRFLED